MQEKNENLSDISERIKQLIDYLGIKPNKFSKNLGYDRTQTIYDVLNKKCAPGFDFFNKLFNSEYSEIINLNWLMTGKGKMIEQKEIRIIESNQIEIPVYQDIQVAAGSGFYNNEPQQADSLITLPNYLLKRNTTHICLRVRGDSMAPTIQDCSYVIARLVDKGDYIQINDEHVFVVVFDGKSYIKRVKNRINQGFIVLCSDNPDKASHPNFNVDVNEIQHLWYVVWYISARMPNIHDQYYARLQRFEDDLEHIKQQLLLK